MATNMQVIPAVLDLPAHLHPGAKVVYIGDLEAYRGPVTLLGPCHCHRCPVQSHIGPYARVEIVTASGQRLVHVGLGSLSGGEAR